MPAGGWASSDAPGALPNTGDTARVLVALCALAARTMKVSIANESIALPARASPGCWSCKTKTAAGPRSIATAARCSPTKAAPTSPPYCDARVRMRWHACQHAAQIDNRAHDRSSADGNISQSQQRDDGSFIPLWFGNEHQPENRIPSSARRKCCSPVPSWARSIPESVAAARRAGCCRPSIRTADGDRPAPVDYSGAEKDGFRPGANEAMAKFCTVEETPWPSPPCCRSPIRTSRCSKAVSRASPGWSMPSNRMPIAGPQSSVSIRPNYGIMSGCIRSCLPRGRCRERHAGWRRSGRPRRRGLSVPHAVAEFASNSSGTA